MTSVQFIDGVGARCEEGGFLFVIFLNSFESCKWVSVNSISFLICFFTYQKEKKKKIK